METTRLKTEEDCNQYELPSSANTNGCAPYAYTQLNNVVIEEIGSNIGCGNDSITITEKLKKEMWQQLGVAGPVVMGNLMEYLTPLLSLIFVGHMGKMKYAGASSTTSMTTSLGYILMVGMATAMETLCGQAYGAQEYHMLGIFLQQGLITLLGACVPLSIIFINMGHVLRLFKQDPQICEMAGKYARGLLPSLFAFAILQPLGRFLQMQSIVWPEVWSSTFSVMFHAFTCWLTISKMGLGFVGAAVSTSVSLWANVGILLLYIKLSGVCKKTWQGFSIHCIHGMKHFLKLSLASSLMICLDYWCFSILILLAGLLPNPQREISALSICLRVSNEIGAGRTGAARLSIFNAMGITLVQSICVSITLFSTRNTLGRVFSNDKDVIGEVSRIIPILSVAAILDGLQAVISGVASGCGWQNLGACASMFALYFVGLPSGIVMAFFFHMRGKLSMEDQMTNSTFLDWVSLLLHADQQLRSKEHMSTSSKKPTTPRGKSKLTEEEMKYKYQKVRMPESQAECSMDVRDSELGHIDMDEFWVRTQKVTRSPWMDKLIGSALHFAGGILVSAVNNEFMMPGLPSTQEAACQKVKLDPIHVPQIEDIYIDVLHEVEIRRKDHSQLALAEIIQYGVAIVLEGFQTTEDEVDKVYNDIDGGQLALPSH
ncbi:hypothetical protein KI387_043716 [Taxus chinensis]|uniref:Protein DETOXIFICATION n=1 Tax=Taxus chinensis TaxID=29808 RepID=A0AA38LRH1_TAXCH|nr:hypothetical protein KI387_043716 [Taxus chinensis]